MRTARCHRMRPRKTASTLRPEHRGLCLLYFILFSEPSRVLVRSTCEQVPGNACAHSCTNAHPNVTQSPDTHNPKQGCVKTDKNMCMKNGVDVAWILHVFFLRTFTRGYPRGKTAATNPYMFHACFATPFETCFHIISALVQASVRHTFRYVVSPRLHTTTFTCSEAKVL